MKKLLSSRMLWSLALLLSACCYWHLYSIPVEAEELVSATETEAPVLQEEPEEEDASFYLPDLSLLKKALDMAGRLAGFGEP